MTDAISDRLANCYTGVVHDVLRKMGHDVTEARARTVSHGRGQAILRLDDGYCAASDGRADGQAVGY